MGGKRIDKRAVHGPSEDRMRRPAEDRKKLRYREDKRPAPEGLNARDAARYKAWGES